MELALPTSDFTLFYLQALQYCESSIDQAMEGI